MSLSAINPAGCQPYTLQYEIWGATTFGGTPVRFISGGISRLILRPGETAGPSAADDHFIFPLAAFPMFVNKFYVWSTPTNTGSPLGGRSPATIPGTPDPVVIIRGGAGGSSSQPSNPCNFLVTINGVPQMQEKVPPTPPPVKKPHCPCSCWTRSVLAAYRS